MTTEVTSAKIIRSSLIALTAAAAVLVTTVLPAEFGIDPLGTGRALGLDGLAPMNTSALNSSDLGLNTERVRFDLAPFESVEYKYRLEAGEGMTFRWQTSQPVTYDFHSEEDGRDPEEAVSFDIGKAAAGAGTFTAPFPGIHGWYWVNRTGGTVTVELDASGFFTASKEYRDGGIIDRAIGK